MVCLQTQSNILSFSRCFSLRGHPKTTLTRGGRQLVGEMSTKGTFYYINCIKFLQKCQPGVGRQLKMVHILSTQFLDDPLNILSWGYTVAISSYKIGLFSQRQWQIFGILLLILSDMKPKRQKKTFLLGLNTSPRQRMFGSLLKSYPICIIVYGFLCILKQNKPLFIHSFKVDLIEKFETFVICIAC